MNFDYNQEEIYEVGNISSSEERENENQSGDDGEGDCENEHDIQNANDEKKSLADDQQQGFETINKEKINIEQEYFEELKNDFKYYYQNKQNYENYKFIEDLKNDNPTLTIILRQEKFLDLINIISELSIQPKLKIYEASSQFFFQNGLQLNLQNKYIRLLISRYFIRVNSSIRYGCFTIDPLKGVIKFKLNSLFGPNWANIIPTNNSRQSQNTQQDDIFTYKRPCFIELLKSIQYTSHYAIGFHIYRILAMINLIKQDIFPFLELQLKDSYRKINPESLKHLTNISEILNRNFAGRVNDQEFTTYRSYFQYPKQQGVETIILSDIKIDTPVHEFKRTIIPDNRISSGGFAEIYRIPLAYTFTKTGNTSRQTRYLVAKKIVKESDKTSLDHEKKILQFQILSENNGECAFIAKFYQSKQQSEFKDFLYMELYQHSSLDQFRSKFKTVQSLNTKLYIMYQVVMGLKYLKDKYVCHIDLKPGNVLISKNFIVKLTDFGESICYKEQRQESFIPGRTFPYASPELDKKKYNEKIDIFSFGIMLYEYLFDEYPVVKTINYQYLARNINDQIC